MCALQWWVTLHLWLGVTLGGLFAMLGLTGSLLFIIGDIDQWLNPSTQGTAPATVPPSAQAVLIQIQQTYPSRKGPWRIEMPLHPHDPVAVRCYQPPERHGRFFAPGC